MAQKIINTKIREAYDTEANWIKHNPVLLAGQLAFSSDKYGKYKVGNGTSTWSQLQYVTLNWGDIGGKPSSFAPTTHNHTISQITDIGNASVKYATTAGSANAVAWNNVSGKPTSMQNPYALTISNFNNTKNVQYDGSSTQAVRLNAQLLYGASDSAIAMANENSSTNTRYVKLLDLTSHNIWQRTNQQFLIATRNSSFLLNIYVSSTDTAKFSQYNISYIPLSSNIEIHRFLTGIVHVDNTKDRFELWYEQQQWTSSVSVIPLGRSYEVINTSGYHFNGYITNSSSEGGITTKPKFDIGIAIEKIMPVLYNGTGNAIDGAMTQQAVTIALETRALKEHSHTIYNITNLQSTLDGKAPTTHEHNFLRVSDTRNENPTPNNAGFKKNAVTFDFKYASKINSPISNTYVGLMSFAPWSETSGGNGYQMAFGYINNTTPRLMLRTADLSATTWGAWYKVYTSADKPTLSELGAAAASHTHNYAGSSSAGGAANSANMLNANAGSSTQPVYFAGGKPVACAYTLGKSVPSNAVFTDTWRPVQNNLTSTSTSDALSAYQGKVLKDLIDGKASSNHSHDTGICTIQEKSNAGTRYVKIAELVCNRTYHRLNQQLIFASRERAVLLNVRAISGNNTIFTASIDYVPISENSHNIINNLYAGLVNISSTQNRIEIWYKQVQWAESLRIIPLGRNAESNALTFKNYSSTDAGSTSAPTFTKTIPINSVIRWENVVGRPSSMPASDVYSWAKASTKPAYSKTEIGLGNVDNTADSNKSVKYATSAGNAKTATNVAWSGITGKPSSFTPSSHSHNAINDFASGTAVSISTSTIVTPETASDYDIVVANTGKYGGNKCVTMSKVGLINSISDLIISRVPLKAITNSQIDSLASL